jgi:cytoskeleton protein RodZ
MNSIGETLRRERLRHNLSLEEVSRETRINLKFLQAIEAEEFGKLPGGVFARSFVRQYARLVGLDEDELAAEVQQRFQPVPAPPEETPARAALEAPIDLPKVADWEGVRSRSGSSLPALALVVVVMLVCSLIYVWWQKSRRPGVAAPPPAESAQVSAPQPATVPAPAPTPQPGAGQAARPAPEAPAPPPEPNAERQPVAEGVAASTAPVQVLLTADEPTWVSARSDGKFIYSGTLQPKETKGLEANEQVRLVLGNAGGVAVTLNGKPVPPLGPRGQVRTVQLSSGGVQIVPPKPREEVSDPL